MKTFDILSMGLRNLLRRKTRTLLTVVGVVVGATAIVMMISLGIGMNDSLDKMIANMGDLTIIEIQSYASIRNSNDEWSSAQNNLDDALLEQIRQMDGVLAVTPYISLYASTYDNLSIYAGKRYQADWASINGIDTSFLPYIKFELDRGEIPTSPDESFILFGSEHIYFIDPNKPIRNWYKEFYNDDGTRKPPKIDILTQNIYMQGKISNNGYWDSMGNYVQNTTSDFKFKKYTFKNVGIMKGGDRDYEAMYTTYIDLETAKSIQAEIEKANKVSKSNSQIGKYNVIRIKATDMKAAEVIQQQLSDMGITISYGLSEMRDELQAQQGTTQMILGGIGAMSLIVAAIGIANTMFMSIYERTKEIGVMKVLGCPLVGIKSMFLFEAGTIGFFGGLLGVGLSLAGSYAMNNVPFISNAFRNMGGASAYSYYADNSGNISIIPMWLITAAIIFSTIIGLGSGYLPARRATKISALEAIRNE